ncbi:MAG TPA: isoprenylcysteine carboxylmethyltransferase family protein [Edaphobacter sp.]|nr:isoprenylcysteine carboxylmethyltransferase family protein [Edaphobacter sp.]
MTGLLVVALGSALWFAPFIFAKRGAGSLIAVDRRARWGLLLQVLGLVMMVLSPFWTIRQFSPRLAVATVLFLLAALLSFTATHSLGRQLRFDAAIGAEHELVRSGPYSFIRHPIYSSMLCLLWAIGSVATPLWLFIAATVVFIAGTEVRVKIEDRLLKDRFGENFLRYQRSAAAYVPLVR